MDTGWVSAFLEVMWKVSLQAAWVAAVVWLIVRCAKNSPASFRYGLWVFVLIKFFVPPMVEFPVQLAFWSAKPESAVVRQSEVGVEPAAVDGAVVAGPRVAAMPSDDVGGRGWIDRRSKAAGVRMASVEEVVAVGWASVALVMLLVLGVRFARQGRVLVGCREGDDRIYELLADAAGSLGFGRLPRLRVSENACTAMLVGVFRPTIILPVQVVETCSCEEIKAMLAHELAHIRRRDMMVVWLYEVVRALFFFHPVVWLAGRELEVERELACDELVVTASFISPADYAAGYVTALKLARRAGQMRPSLGMAEPFEVGKRRLTAILRGDVPRLSGRWIAAMGVVAVVGLPTFAAVAKMPVKPVVAKAAGKTTGAAAHKTAKRGSSFVMSKAQMIAGLAALKGPGVLVTLIDSPRVKHAAPNTVEQYLVHAQDILMLVNELFDAGAEAVSVNGQRIGAMSAIRSTRKGITVNGVVVAPPFKISAIGDPKSLDYQMKMSGGVLDSSGLLLLDMATVKSTGERVVPALSSSADRRVALTATKSVRGAGVVIRLVDSPKLNKQTDPDVVDQYRVRAQDILGLVNDLNAAGATAIAVNGERWVATSSVRSVAAMVMMKSTRLAPPYVISAIGDASGLEKAVLAKGSYAGGAGLTLLDMVSVKRVSRVRIGPFEDSEQMRWAEVVKRR